MIWAWSLPPSVRAQLLATRASALRLCGMQSFPSKSSLYSPVADLTALPADMPSLPSHLSGRCSAMVIVGAPVGST
eukprot:6205716-Pleurochrysis_carterae.AAC.1